MFDTKMTICFMIFCWGTQFQIPRVWGWFLDIGAWKILVGIGLTANKIIYGYEGDGNHVLQT